MGELIQDEKNELMQNNLIEENKQYGDILQCNFIDNYHALPIKVGRSLLLILK